MWLLFIDKKSKVIGFEKRRKKRVINWYNWAFN